MGAASTQRIDTLVIGAGQAGLSAGYHLARRGLPFVILDADARIGDHWRDHWDSLRLYSPARSDGLPGMRFPAASYHWPTAREMADYLETYAGRFHLPVLSGVRVDAVRPADAPADGFIVEAGDHTWHAAQVIVATGAFRVPSVPEFAPLLHSSIRQLHSSEYHRPSDVAAGPVLVVGVSHSGADIAFELSSTHPTMLAGHSHGELPIRVTDTPRARLGWPVVSFLFSRVLTLRTPMGRRMAPHVRMGGGPLLRVRSGDLARAGVQRLDGRVVGVRDGQPLLDDGRTIEAASIVWATGFRPDYDWVRVDGFLGADGWPAGRRGVSEAAPGMYFLGVPFQWAFSSMLVGGAGRDASYVVKQLAQRVRARRTAGSMVPATAIR
jgi:putative flavoprotein involved in K+ transport